jgi:hypothetical protein
MNQNIYYKANFEHSWRNMKFIIFWFLKKKFSELRNFIDGIELRSGDFSIALENVQLILSTINLTRTF